MRSREREEPAFSAKCKNFLTQERDFRNNSFDARILGHQITGKSALTTNTRLQQQVSACRHFLKFFGGE